MEYLVEIDIKVPTDIGPDERSCLFGQEAIRGMELAKSGHLRAVWRVPGRHANRAIWSAGSATELHECITSLPLWPYMDVTVIPLARHGLASQCPGVPQGLEIDMPNRSLTERP